MNMYFHTYRLNMVPAPNLVVRGRTPHMYCGRWTLRMTPPSPHWLPRCRWVFGDTTKVLQGFGNKKDMDKSPVTLGLLTAWK